MDNDDFLTIAGASQLTGVHEVTLRRWCREGLVSAFKAAHEGSSVWFISRRSLNRYLDPVYGFALDRPGPKLFLTKQKPD